MLFRELRRHGKLAAKRHPMYEKNRFGKLITKIMGLFWIGYLIFFGVSIPMILKESLPNMEPYHLLNSGLFIIWGIDFLSRFPFQKTPTQEIKPYLLLPIKKKQLLDFLLLRSGSSLYNMLWLFFFIPTSIVGNVVLYFGFWGMFTYCLGIYLTMICNNYWFLLCRTLMRERIWWGALPLAFYAGLAVLLFVFDVRIDYFTRDLGEGFIEGNFLMFLGTIALIALLWFINRALMSKVIYTEVNKIEDTKVATISEYKVFEQYGEVGEYMRLELKLLLRNKRCRSSIRSIGILVVVLSGMLSFGKMYDDFFMSNFIGIYSFTAFGTVLLTQIMSFEGNYLDGLMTRKESIYSVLRAKYMLYSLGNLIPLALMIPAIVMGKLTVLTVLAYLFFAIGPIYFFLFQLAVYNTHTTKLNENVSARQQGNNAFQTLFSVCGIGLPLLILYLSNMFLSEQATLWFMLCIGLLFTLTSQWWLRNIYNRFMKRRYKNMEGFRNSR